MTWLNRRSSGNTVRTYSIGEAVLRFAPFLLGAVFAVACAPKPATVPNPVPSRPRPPRVVRDTVTVQNPELERRLSRLEFRVLEKEAQVEELETRLNDARDEVVRTMAKLQTLASRAEAASAMAEADVALQSFRASEGSRQLPEMTQATRLVQQSTAEFSKENYGGALYLANQAKSAAAAGRARLGGATRGTPRAGETPFALPVPLRIVNRGNVREGPGTNFPVAFEVESGATLTGIAYTDEWVRVVDGGGRNGWIFRTLIARP
jgi:uncharacterized coiled-coil protein SlyX